MRIAIGSDHAGFEMKEAIKAHLERLKIEYNDYGTYNTDSMDYPDTGKAVANAVAEGKEDRGILICGSGIGMSIVANKVKGIRAALCYSSEIAKLSREHNDSNILVLAGRFTSRQDAKEMVKVWIDTPFSNDPRHIRRIEKIEY
ncbi:MAG: ribose 5-phosphate isomerase B [Candidatus Cloacimonadales bacterium]|jgi:ribose 5-phosphate isomerase B|nr:ribose 5-phosphate isomerase B [Candidatus Cloacimonadota bacterium]MDD2650684.1 ribose 5-phosphate isomerase B [Candidatus Cloacimonadota bacterium]MDD3502340.1 ribose 5-phosphate isomerase B [Candidatus Cloacimonadota bacterium]MDX9976701.1 ribose 5-phosphate isomerase B [Candidatus Cloacimonadales bacterium]